MGIGLFVAPEKGLRRRGYCRGGAAAAAGCQARCAGDPGTGGKMAQFDLILFELAMGQKST